jgi:hypothetical protein
MNTNQNTPLISKTAFNCPHCGAYTTQYWSKLFVGSYDGDVRTPGIPDEKFITEIQNDKILKEEMKYEFISWAKNMMNGKPFIESSTDSPYHAPILNNCNISKCYNCKEIAVWVHDKMVYPSDKIDIQPNGDLPELVKRLFDEARSIVTDSPKGAAALLRLCIQHLCVELGESGKNLDSAIANLVSKGLNPMVQKALDVVRVIGNESVHPGEINLNDKKDTAVKLFGLVNLIAEQMISHPRHVQELYNELPEKKRDSIEKRNESAINKSTT